MSKSVLNFQDIRHRYLFSLIIAVLLLIGIPQLVLAANTGLNGNATAPKAYSLVQQNKIKLIDIRRPSEWRQTGVGKGAHKISMHQNGFVSRIEKLVGGDRSKPIALICARGVRSAWMKSKLNAAGFTHVINVSEGMLGSFAGPGWMKRKLPVR